MLGHEERELTTQETEGEPLVSKPEMLGHEERELTTQETEGEPGSSGEETAAM
ncbi:hypothetical protein PGTUg99_011045 [Puccinia graminis f. sp. tritici]|uniref:Uncharacterized protein n=1 Tax=Puccinia graminis f. sp. tritici TaxID=56615 RepID=A0A5B0S754_PUCGR|nr:hypothetical protein PGTUg99_010796 [Puccinia graminis f. sp. tritici]KAA1132455.1 hypothetical protein PGTUg99_011045 [Puccinia graminis f. sp. tritici]